MRKGGIRLETRLVPNEQELLNIERQLTHGLKPTNRPMSTKGNIYMYHSSDSTLIKVRDFSTSGGRTIDIIPPNGGSLSKPEIRLHIKKG